MSITSLNNNQAALVAQLNISNANTATTNEVAALSSGNRIVQASTDVAALATGTALSSQVNTLNTSLTVASEGSSLLQVADGALSQIQSILQRQQAIATQAQSGSLSGTQLGFLDEEFQNLTSQIDQLAGSTNFNGVQLINGSISGSATVTTNANITSSATANSATVATLATVANNDTLTINGLKVTFTTATAGTAAASGDVQIGKTAADTAANLTAFLNNDHAPQLANLQFTSTGGGVVQATYSGGALQGTLTVTASTSDSAQVTLAGSTFTLASTTAANIEYTQGIGISRYSAAGTVTGSVLVSPGAGTTQFGSAVDLSSVKNNAAFIGNFGGATIGSLSATYVSQDHASFSITVGADTYTSGSITLTGSVPQAITFTGADSAGTKAGGTFTINLAGSAFTAATINGQTDVNNAVAQLNTALAGVTVNQNRTLTSFQAGAVVENSAGTQVGNLSGAQITLNGSSFNDVDISSLSITAPTNGGSDATVTAVINGDTYVSGAGLGNQIGTNTVIGLQDTSNPANYLTIVTGNTGIASDSSTALDLSTQANADLVATSLKSAIGLSNANASLTFQVGSATSDTLGVSIGSATTNSLFDGQTLDVKSQADATTAFAAVSNALNTVTALRANVGALEERFNYASNAITSASQNEGAAESTLLDTDVSSESTQFATSQVQLQAGIAVLAQANQLQQNLLKLIS